MSQKLSEAWSNHAYSLVYIPSSQYRSAGALFAGGAFAGAAFAGDRFADAPFVGAYPQLRVPHTTQAARWPFHGQIRS